MSRADEPLKRALVIVGVEGGIADPGVYGPSAADVAVVVVDWDVLKGASGDLEEAQEHYRYLTDELAGYADADPAIRGILDDAHERVQREEGTL